MHADTAPGQTHPVGHGGGHKLRTGRWLVLADVRIGTEDIPCGIDDFAVERGVFIRLFFQNGVVVRRGAETLASRGNRGPSRILVSNGNGSPLGVQIDDHLYRTGKIIAMPFVEGRRLGGEFRLGGTTGEERGEDPCGSGAEETPDCQVGHPGAHTFKFPVTGGN